MKLKEAADGWIEEKSEDVSEATLTKYNQMIRNNLYLIMDKEADVSDMVSQIPKFEERLQQKDYSEASAKRARQLCQQVLTWGQLHGQKQENDGMSSLMDRLKSWADSP